MTAELRPYLAGQWAPVQPHVVEAVPTDGGVAIRSVWALAERAVRFRALPSAPRSVGPSGEAKP